MIVKPENMNFDSKKFVGIIYGAPGTGKTTLGLSAPNPILFDFDKGISRVKAHHRKDTIFCDKYEDVLQDLPDIGDYETVVLDTGGSFITYLQDWAMRQNPVNKQKNGALSQKGFGAVKQEFKRFSDMIRITMNKNLIYIFHSEEKADKDGNPIQRLLCEGSAKNIVWQYCDFGGYVQMINGKRTISFTPTDEYFAKSSAGIGGQREVPDKAPSEKNDFMTKLFEEAKANMEAENETFAPLHEAYQKAMEEATKIILSIETVEQANEAVKAIPALDHALTSKKEASALLNDRAKELGFTWDKTSKSYIDNSKKEETASAPEQKEEASE